MRPVTILLFFMCAHGAAAVPITERRGACLFASDAAITAKIVGGYYEHGKLLDGIVEWAGSDETDDQGLWKKTWQTVSTFGPGPGPHCCALCLYLGSRLYLVGEPCLELIPNRSADGTYACARKSPRNFHGYADRGWTWKDAGAADATVSSSGTRAERPRYALAVAVGLCVLAAWRP